MLCIGGAIVLDYWKTVIGLTDLIHTEISPVSNFSVTRACVALITFTRK